MIYTEENFKESKSGDVFDFVCPVCGKIFHKTKGEISKNHNIVPVYCSKDCFKASSKTKYVSVVCKECGKEYEIEEREYNRKIKNSTEFFCSRSCSAKYNNKKYPKRKKQEKVKKKRFSCRDLELGYYIGYGNERRNYLTHKCAQIRRDARKFMETESKQEKVCKYCGNHEYDDILEVHHLKSILDFDEHTKIYKINSDGNLVWLCPNHHAMLERGLIEL